MDDWLSVGQTAAAAGDWTAVLGCLQEGFEQGTLQQADAAIQQSALELALRCLEDGTFQIRWEVAKLIPQFGAIALLPLLSALDTTEFDDEDWEFHWFAARLIGEFDHPDAIATLLSLLQSETPDLVQVASDALASRGASVVDALALAANQPTARRGVAQTLARIDHSSVIAPLLCLAEDHESDIRAIALEALTRFSDERIPSLLVQSLTDQSARVRQAAVTGIGLWAQDLDPQHTVELIEPLLADLNEQVSRQAAIALGRIGTTGALHALGRAWQSPYTAEPLRHEIVQVLGQVPQEDALLLLEGYLSDLLASPQPIAPDARRLGQAIVSTLGRTESPLLRPVAVAILVNVLQHLDREEPLPQLRQAIAFSLGQLQNPQAMDVLIQMLADEDASVRLHAIAALRQIAPVEARARIEQLSKEETASLRLQQGAAFALAEWPR